MTKKKNLVIFGNGVFGEWISKFVEADNRYRILGYTVDYEYCTGKTFLNCPLIPWEQLKERFHPREIELLLPASYKRLNQFRLDRFNQGKNIGFNFTTFIHPGASVHTKNIGEGCIVLDQTLIEAGCKLGDGAIVLGQSLIGHHSIIGDFCFIGGQVGLSGRVTLGKECFLAGKVGVYPGVEIGERSFIEIGAMVHESIPNNSVVRSGSRSRVSSVPTERIHRLL